ncbi:MAG: hypothetical protein KF891_07835 [Rhizobacter sp.]|nr:hypothetical protein [Rhizobacter sp.]
MHHSTMAPGFAGHELRFRSLFNEGRGYSFPCDASGCVDIDALSERARSNYFFARTVIGRELAFPVVQACELH